VKSELIEVVLVISLLDINSAIALDGESKVTPSA